MLKIARRLPVGFDMRGIAGRRGASLRRFRIMYVDCKSYIVLCYAVADGRVVDDATPGSVIGCSGFKNGC
jgi:hypothetical protein